ncbi:unnamed protein product [Periconia digitata]|uniref:Uncharacterized protein n=1 Tax=Periconia digitata TaxID=1303443 RepID=A0A9W4UQQ7_9PLEO|nr:unnamed protein product [Periconia digitata]
MAASAPLAVPASPASSSSKRSRSRDSIADNRHLNVAAASVLSPSHSAPSLIIPESHQQPPVPPQNDPTPYPAFLRLKKPQLRQNFDHLELAQRQRIQPATSPPHDQLPSQWARCTWPDAINRNRYANVDPYQTNRVRLHVPDGHNDYINASPIELTTSKSRTPLRYIATQGPRSDTVSDFWRMVWHETTDPAVVVMLTQTHESGREKCFPYYPQALAQPELKLNPHDEYSDGFLHNLRLISLADHADARAQIRELEMSPAPLSTSSSVGPSSASSSPLPATPDPKPHLHPNPTETRKICHLLFAGWPDFQVPEGADRAALLELIRISRVKNEHNLSNPRIVHCSAGVGRSGTFIALDWLLQELDEGSLDAVPDAADPVADIVDTLRQQRMMMVQGEAQLGFIYDVLRERWRDRWVLRCPDEAAKLGVAPAVFVTAPASVSVAAGLHNDGPRLKRQKSVKEQETASEHGTPSFRVDDVNDDEDEDEDEDEDDSNESYQEEGEDLLDSQGGGTGRIIHRAELEAELSGAEMVFERGKT